MGVGELLAWQWSDYPQKHQHRTNLLLHIVAIPVFMAGTVLLLAGIATLSIGAIVTGVAAWGVALVAEGRGHKMEPETPAPFTGAGNFVSRFFLEQWITFPRYVLTGGWWRALNRAL